MYTGITRGTFPVVDAQRRPGHLRYQVALPEPLRDGLTLGASVAIDGVCQTVTEIEGDRVAFDAIEETLRLTTLGSLESGHLVSVERSARVGDEIGGHDVAGHVVGMGEIKERRFDEERWDLCVGVPQDWMRYILAKGFIAVDGSSLPVGETDPSGAFWLHLIPETLRLTNLGRKLAGDRVNIELDSRTVAIVDTVERVLAAREAP